MIPSSSELGWSRVVNRTMTKLVMVTSVTGVRNVSRLCRLLRCIFLVLVGECRSTVMNT